MVIYGIQKIMGHREGVFMVIRLGGKLSFRLLLHTGVKQVLKNIEQGFPHPFSAMLFIYLKVTELVFF